MNKIGQLTIFILVAIIIIGMAVLFFALQTGLIKQKLSPESERIQVFVQECIEEEGIDVINQISKNGGYFFPPNLSTSSGVAIYYDEGITYIPLKEQIENEISFYLNEKLFFCTRNFVDFPDLEVSQGEIKTNVQIQDEKVILNVNYPVRIIYEDSTTLLEKFKVEVPIRLGILYDSVAEFMQQQEDNENICLSCLLEITTKNDLYVDMIDFDEQTTIFVFRDENSKINDETFVWVFANRYVIG